MCDADNDYGLIELKQEEGGWWSYIIEGSNGSPIYGRTTGRTRHEVYASLHKQVHKANERRRAQSWQKWNWAANSPAEQLEPEPELELKAG